MSIRLLRHSTDWMRALFSSGEFLSSEPWVPPALLMSSTCVHALSVSPVWDYVPPCVVIPLSG